MYLNKMTYRVINVCVTLMWIIYAFFAFVNVITWSTFFVVAISGLITIIVGTVAIRKDPYGNTFRYASIFCCMIIYTAIMFFTDYNFVFPIGMVMYTIFIVNYNLR